MIKDYFPLIVAAIGFLGGTIATLIGTFVKARLDAKAERQRWAREDSTRFHEERTKGYSAFLKAMAAIEHVSTQGILTIIDPEYPDPIDSVEKITAYQDKLDQLETAYLMVSIVGTRPVREKAEQYRDSVFTSKLPPKGSPRESYVHAMHAYTTEIKRLRQAFLDATRKELGVTDA